MILPRGSVLRDMLEPMDIPVYEIDGMADRSYDRADVGKLKEMIRRIDPDIVHTHGRCREESRREPAAKRSSTRVTARFR